MTDSIEPKTHLEKQRAQLQLRIDGLEAQLAQTQSALNQTRPAVVAALTAFKEGLQRLCAERSAALYAAAYAQSLSSCLTLKPLGATKRTDSHQPVLVAWLAIAATFLLVRFLLPDWLGSIATLLALVPASFLYLRFLRAARAESARHAARAGTQALQEIEQYQPLLLQVGSSVSGNKNYPYSIVQMGLQSGQGIDTVRQFDPKSFGDAYGATLLTFASEKSPNGVGYWFRLPAGDQAFQTIDVSDKRSETQRFALIDAQLPALAGQHAAALVQAVRALSAQVEERRGVTTDLDGAKVRMKALTSQEAAWRNVAVNPETLDEIVVQIELFKLAKAGAPKGMLLYGPPGTGKTSIARNLAQTSGCKFIAVGLADLKGQFQGQTAPAVVNIWKRARESAPCILFIDECEGILGARSERSASGSNVNFDNELVETFLAEWDGVNSSAGQVFLVGATNRRDNLDGAIVQRFNAVIEVGLPNVGSRKRILELEFAARNIKFPVSDKMAKETAGMSGRDIFNLTNLFHGALLSNEASEAVFTDVIKKARGKTSTMTDGVSWEQVILAPKLKTKLEGLGRKIKRAEEYEKAGFPVPKSLLLYGPPGTGKTQIARALATESGLAFKAVTTSEVKGSHTGESGKRVRQIFATARGQAPCLLFIDEIDIVTPKRGYGDSFSQEIVGQLLQEMDGINARAGTGFVFVLAATNCIEKIDEAVLSRFGEPEPVPLPDADARVEILGVLLKGKPIDFELDLVLRKLADATEGFSGRDLATLVTAAANEAMQRADHEGLEIEDIRILESDFVGVNIGKRTVELQ
jgi:transitional endoplasmic reticulum ATPase